MTFKTQEELLTENKIDKFSFLAYLRDNIYNFNLYYSYLEVKGIVINYDEKGKMWKVSICGTKPVSWGAVFEDINDIDFNKFTITHNYNDFEEILDEYMELYNA